MVNLRICHFERLKKQTRDDLLQQQARWMAAQKSRPAAIKYRIKRAIKRVFGTPLDSLLREVELNQSRWSIHYLMEVEDLKKDLYVHCYGFQHSKDKLEQLTSTMRDQMRPADGNFYKLYHFVKHLDARVGEVKADRTLWTIETYSELKQLQQHASLKTNGLQFSSSPLKKLLQDLQKHLTPKSKTLEEMQCLYPDDQGWIQQMRQNKRWWTLETLHKLKGMPSEAQSRSLRSLVSGMSSYLGEYNWNMADLRSERFEAVDTATIEWYALGKYTGPPEKQDPANDSSLPPPRPLTHEQLDPNKVQSYRDYITSSQETLETPQVLDVIEIADALSDTATIDQILGDAQRATHLLKAAVGRNRREAVEAIGLSQRALFRQQSSALLTQAASQSNPAMVQFLCELGATYMAKNHALADAIQQATPRDQHLWIDSIQTLLEQGANPDVKIISSERYSRRQYSPRQTAKYRRLQKIVHAIDQTTIKIYPSEDRKQVRKISRYVLFHHPYFQRKAGELSRDFNQLLKDIKGVSPAFINGIIDHSNSPKAWQLVAGDDALVNAQLELLHHDLALQPELRSKFSQFIAEQGSIEMIKAVIGKPYIDFDDHTFKELVLLKRNEEAAAHFIAQENDLRVLLRWLKVMIPRIRRSPNYAYSYKGWRITKMVADRLVARWADEHCKAKQHIEKTLQDILPESTDEQTLQQIHNEVLSFLTILQGLNQEARTRRLLIHLYRFRRTLPLSVRKEIAEKLAAEITELKSELSPVPTEVLKRLSQHTTYFEKARSRRSGNSRDRRSPFRNLAKLTGEIEKMLRSAPPN